jgi:DnaJ-class molecular chaperone with C-terminal Zn finger domain
MDDFYKALEVERSASGDEIKANYRKLAMKWHPDRNAGSAEAEERFKAISEAYSVLSDASSRQAYDARLTAWESGAPDPGAAAQGAGYGYGSQYSGYGAQSQAQYASQAAYEEFFRGFAQAAEEARRENVRRSFTGGFTREQAADMFMNEMYDLAIELTMQNVRWKDIAAELVKRGCPEAAATEIARKIEKRRKELVRGTARPYFLRSALSGAFGLVLVALFGGMGLGIIGFFGLVMVLSAGYNLVRALYYMATGNTPKRALI